MARPTPATSPALLRLPGWIYPAALLLLTFIAFFPATRAGFLNFDDPLVVTANPDFANAETANLGHYWLRPHLGLYTPVTYTLLGFVAGLARASDGALDPAPFHAFNVCLHALSALLVYAILRQLMAARSVAPLICGPAAAAGAALFALHPLQAETVAWISSTNTNVSGVLALWSTWHALKFFATGRDAKREERPRRTHLWIGLAAYVLAMLGKPSAVIVPGLVGALAVLVMRVPWRTVALALLPWALAAVPLVVMTKVAQPAQLTWTTPVRYRPLIATDALAFYLAKLAAPIHLRPDYGRTPQLAIARGWVRWTWVLPVGLLAIAWPLRRRSTALAALAVFAIALLPVLGLTPFQFQLFSTVADRYAYLAMLGPAVLVASAFAYVASRWPAHSTLALVVVGVAAVGLTVATVRQTSVWRDDQTLFGHTMRFNPDSLAAHQVLGQDAMQAGDIPGAMAHFEQALRTDPDDGFSHFEYANLLLMALRQPAAAVPHYRAAARQLSDRAPLLNNFGIALLQTGQPDEALAQFERAARADPKSADARANVAMMLAARGDRPGAIAQYRAALAIDPNHPGARRGLADLGQ